ncbi:proteasome accessory factor B [Microlunatus sagamiharensis]|uniref:Proteasome accessory factor B n=1 Tax=Microlunatus sagamiharensis TaxID=546874 RepID=A0A1H2LWU6_9ACTN|nr:WYL domain-containing protein [Microlunatus sagamiharensis]SDU85457.1 proteasome accessory factor B [Microlunatus sagamiharensis]
MAPRKTERIVNLTIALLVAGRYLPKTRIRELVEGYHGLTDAAFERTFERDKDELRELGVPIEVGGYDPLFDDEAGYRILPSEFSLPPIELDAEEASVVGVAARVWQHASMASSTQSAMTKLRAAGVEPDPSALAALEPSVQATEAAFGPLWNAVLERVRVRFTYRDGSLRTLEPWGLTSRRGRWYVVGRDVDREATRMFKLSRIGDVPVAVSRPGAFEAPEGLDLRTLAAKLDPQEATAEALLAVRTGKAPSLTRRGRREGTSDLAWAAGGREGWWVGYGSLPGMAEEVAGHGADVLVVEPVELREAVVGRLREVAARAGAVAR